jgi:omega-3 fatty acid desaturase (delta-15 desaturase)
MMYQLPERLYKSLDSVVLMLRFRLPFPMLAYPFYLANRSPGKSGSHFHPASDLFQPSESKTCWLAMAALLAGLTLSLSSP